MSGKLLFKQVLFGNVEFFLSRISRKAYYLHAVEKRRRNGIGGVCGDDKENVRKIEGNFNKMIVKFHVLLRVQRLKKGCGGVSLKSEPSLSISSIRISGFWLFACLTASIMRPGIEPI